MYGQWCLVVTQKNGFGFVHTNYEGSLRTNHAELGGIGSLESIRTLQLLPALFFSDYEVHHCARGSFSPSILETGWCGHGDCVKRRLVLSSL